MELTMSHSNQDWAERERRCRMIRLWLMFRERIPLADGLPLWNGYGGNRRAEVAFA